MPRGAHFDQEHQQKAVKARWDKATSKDRAHHLRAAAAGMLRRAEELDPTFTTEQMPGEFEATDMGPDGRE